MFNLVLHQNFHNIKSLRPCYTIIIQPRAIIYHEYRQTLKVLIRVKDCRLKFFRALVLPQHDKHYISDVRLRDTSCTYYLTTYTAQYSRPFAIKMIINNC
jgi:hypothetical protein